MSKFVVNIDEKPPPITPNETTLGAYQKPKKRGRFAKIAIAFAGLIAAFLLIAAIGGYFYWQSYKSTPQYSLALLIDAARRDDQRTVDSLVDANAVVDDFMPQITGKAVELYGRGLPPQTIARAERVAAPLLPAVKERAKSELPRVIREKTDKFANVPFAAIVLGADKYLEIQQNGSDATVKSKFADRPLEVKMKKNGENWQIVGLKDEQLATQIAQKIGQEILAVAAKGGINKAGENLGIQNLQDLLQQADGFLK